MLPIDQYLKMRDRPIGEPMMLQSWRDLCFLHYPIDPVLIRNKLPDELEIDTFPDENGIEKAWIGIIAFTMEGIRIPGSLALPWLSAFPETNVRTYVHKNGANPGVWFFSLDATRRLGCEFARCTFGLNYLHSEMIVNMNKSQIEYQIRRLDEPHAFLSLNYNKPEGLAPAVVGTFDFWIIERYLLYSRKSGVLFSGAVSHKPYEFGEVCQYELNTDLPESIGISQSPICHAAYSPGVDVEVFGLKSVCQSFVQIL